MTDFVRNVSVCAQILQEQLPVVLIYYSHITVIALSIFFASYVLIRNKRDTLSNYFFVVNFLFSLWVINDLITWTASHNSALTMFAWSTMELIEVSFFFASINLSYFFLFRKKIPIIVNTILIIPVLIIFYYTVTGSILSDYNIVVCEATENENIINSSVLFADLFYVALIIGMYIWSSIKTAKEFLLRNTMFFAGLLFFLILYLATLYISDYVENYNWSLIALAGMPIFLALMGFSAVKFKIFNFKILGAQTLVFLSIFLVGSQFIFLNDNVAILLNIFTTVILIAGGILLVRSVKKVEEQRESLDIANRSLETANEKLKGLDKLKTEFLSLASHQLRSPLTAIKGYASMLVEGSFGKLVDQKQDEAVRRIYASAQGLANIVEDLLNVSKIEQGGMKYEMMPTDMAPLVTQLYNEMSIPATNKGLEFTLDMAPNEKFEATIDPLKMKQVFLNLTDNSIKYTQKGFVKLILKREGKNITFAVSDSGAGISPETKAKLFEKFSRGEGGKMNTGGSGLGLYLAREITRAHKGDIIIESEGLGKGSTFKVVIPVA